MAGLIACAVVLACASAFGIAWRRREGLLRAAGPASAAGRGARGAARQGPLTGAQIGAPLGERATLLQFSSEFCAPCRATRRVLADVARGTEGVAHVEVDAGDRLDLVRLLDVRRTPTVFVLGPDGRVRQRGSGLMRTADVLAALGEPE